MYAYCVMISYNTTILYIIIEKYSSRTFLHCLLVSLLPTSSMLRISSAPRARFCAQLDSSCLPSFLKNWLLGERRAQRATTRAPTVPFTERRANEPCESPKGLTVLEVLNYQIRPLGVSKWSNLSTLKLQNRRILFLFLLLNFFTSRRFRSFDIFKWLIRC